MIVSVYDFTRGNESYEMIKLVRHAGSIRLSRAKLMVEQFLSGDLDCIEFTCDDADGPAVLARIAALGFLAEQKINRKETD